MHEERKRFFDESDEAGRVLRRPDADEDTEGHVMMETDKAPEAGRVPRRPDAGDDVEGHSAAFGAARSDKSPEDEESGEVRKY